jgi:hypothetical protein
MKDTTLSVLLSTPVSPQPDPKLLGFIGTLQHINYCCVTTGGEVSWVI